MFLDKIDNIENEREQLDNEWTVNEEALKRVDNLLLIDERLAVWFKFSTLLTVSYMLTGFFPALVIACIPAIFPNNKICLSRSADSTEQLGHLILYSINAYLFKINTAVYSKTFNILSWFIVGIITIMGVYNYTSFSIQHVLSSLCIVMLFGTIWYNVKFGKRTKALRLTEHQLKARFNKILLDYNTLINGK